MKSLVNAQFDGLLSTERGTHCAVGTILHDLLGFRVGKESWMPLLASYRFALPIPDGLEGLQEMITEKIDLSVLNTVDVAFNIDEDLDSKMRRVLKVLSQVEEVV